jgi:secreted trypsin-like serine protease
MKYPRITRLLAVVATFTASALVVAAPAQALSGGTPAADGSYQFTAKIMMDGRACTGALIAPQWVITSASCFPENAQGGAPTRPTTVIVGRTNLTSTAGHVANVTTLVVRADRDVALARLDTAITDITPVALSTTAPAAGDVLRIAGYGRTTTDWVPDQLRTSTFSVTSSAGASLAVTGDNGVDTCKGDAGGPALQEASGHPELVAVSSLSWQHGCLDVTETRQGSTETRVDDIAAWVQQQIPSFFIRNFNGLCTGLNAPAAGTPVTMATCAPTSGAQQWTIPGDGTLRSATGLCATLTTGKLTSATCASGDARQQWVFNTDGTLRNADGSCADLGSNAQGTPVITTTCVAGSISRQWSLTGDGTLRNFNGLCVDLRSNAAGTPMIIATCGASLISQRWGTTPAGALRNTNSLCADIGSNAPGTTMVMVACNAALTSQKWTLTPSGTLVNFNGLCADLRSNAPGTNLIMVQCQTGNTSQQWKLSH